MHDAADYRARVAVINDDTDYLNLMRDLLETEGGYEALICREWEDAHGFIKRFDRPWSCSISA
jgi:DNA-binding NtrC family response regulator